MRLTQKARLDATVRDPTTFSEEPFWNEEEATDFAQEVVKALKLPETDLQVVDGQPFRLGLLKSLALLMDDPDAQLPCTLAHGIDIGIRAPIEPTGIWRTRAPSCSLAGET